MNNLSRLWRGVAGVSLLALLPLASEAQGMATSSPPLQPPSAARTEPIRGGADPGSAAISGPSRPASQSSGGDATKRLWCADNDDPGFRRSMSQCTSLLDQASRLSCVEHVREARRDEAAQLTFPTGAGFVGGAASPDTVASLERRAVSRDCVY